MNSPPLTPIEEIREAQPDPALTRSVRGTLVGIGLGLAVVFAIAIWLRPYDEDGNPKRMGTHQKTPYGTDFLPECTFKKYAGVPCPSCGMTTSFSLLVRGDVWNSLRANWVGTGLCVLCLLILPWSFACAILGKRLFIASMERAMLRIIVIFLSAMMLRWVVVVGLTLWERYG